MAAIGTIGLAAWLVIDLDGALAVVCVLLLLQLFGHARRLAALEQWLREPMARPVPQDGGAWEEALVGLYRLVRDRLRREQQLSAELARFRDLGLALPDGVVLLDAQDHIQWCNPIASHYLGLDAKRDRGQPLVNLVRHPDLALYLQRGEFSEPLSLRIERGEMRVLALSVVAYGDAQRLLLASDITLAEKVETMRRDFVANVSHELKSPLTVVAGFLDTLLDADVALDDARRLAYLQLMREHTGRMQRLVEDLLALSALESGRGLSDEVCVDMRALLVGLRDEALALSAGRHRFVLEVDEGVDLLGNAQELRSAFSNLISNAVHYTPAGGEIHVFWRRRGERALFGVSDDGPGIEARHLPRLTERFYRVDQSRSRESGGTGLGLAIVKHVLTRHQAALDIQSVPGRGSTFNAVFPEARIVAAPATSNIALGSGA